MVVRIMSGVLFILILYLLVVLFSLTRVEAEPQIIPRELLFGNPAKARPRLSPDGEQLAYLAPLDGVLNVWVRTLDAADDRAITKDTHRGIMSYFWQEDSKHILYVQDTDGDENWRLYSVNVATQEVKKLTPFDGVQVRLLAHEKDFPNDVLIQMNKRDPTFHDVYHLDLLTGDLKMVAENPGNFTSWIADSKLKVRGATVAGTDGSDSLLIRDTEDSDWKKIATWDLEDTMASGPLGFTKHGESIYLKDSRGVNTGRLVKMEIGSGKIDVLAEDPDYDVSGVLVHPDSYEIQMVFFTKARQEWRVLDASIQKDIDAIRGLNDGDFVIVSRDNSLRQWLIAFVKDDGPVDYYLYDSEKKSGTFLFNNQPELEDYTLARMEPISLTSRDNRTLHGYLTLPPGVSREEIPMVLLVHGGPWSRDTWGYDPRAQWLANRGYAALQVNYRGSIGYGKDFVNAGDKEWGGKMQEDLVDATNWAVKQGIADPQRLAIFGGSYGGYAALVGVTFTPDLFRCAVSIVGPSNLITFLQSVPPYWKNYLSTLYRRVGNPATEADFLKSRSPLFKVDQIKVPVLIAQGANDPRVKQAESEQIVEAMKRKGLDYEYILFEDEGHGFTRPENRLKFYADAEKFLAKHLGGRYEE